MPALRWACLFVICLALSGCCTFGEMCAAPPTSGPAMAWDGTGQAPDRKVAKIRHPHHDNSEIVTGSLNPIVTDPTAQPGAVGSASTALRDETSAAEAELKQKLVICRGCLTEPATAPIANASTTHQMTASAAQ
jgi:hypothetical protein